MKTLARAIKNPLLFASMLALGSWLILMAVALSIYRAYQFLWG